MVNKALTHLNLENNSIDEADGMILGRMLAVNRTLTHLNLSSNDIRAHGAHSLAEALKVNDTLIYLNLMRNGSIESAVEAFAITPHKKYTAEYTVNTKSASLLRKITGYLERNKRIHRDRITPEPLNIQGVDASSKREEISGKKRSVSEHADLFTTSTSPSESSAALAGYKEPPLSLAQVSTDSNNYGDTILALNIAISLTEITMGEKIGEGGFGIVCSGEYQGKTVALKMLRSNVFNDSNDFDEFKKEAIIMAKLDSRYIVQLLGICLEPNNYALVMEYMGGGMLWDLLKDHQFPMSWGVKLGYSLDIAKGMKYLHSNKIVHCDLKSLNVLFDDQYKIAKIAKIADFGLSKVKQRANTMSSSHYSTARGGSPLWTAPEIFQPGVTSHKNC